MQNKNLPETYEGFPTEELLKILEMRLNHQSLEGIPREKIIAMDDLAMDYLLTPVHRAASQSKFLLIPSNNR